MTTPRPLSDSEYLRFLAHLRDGGNCACKGPFAEEIRRIAARLEALEAIVVRLGRIYDGEYLNEDENRTFKQELDSALKHQAGD